MTADLDAAATDGDASVVDGSGLFDPDWYLASHPELAERANPLMHFCREGWRQGFQPNPFFHPAWYARTYGTEFLPDENPLLHYIRVGEREHAWPSAHFDPEWYRDTYAIDERESPLRHYLLHRFAGTYSPLPSFDVAAYTAEHPEWLASGQDPYWHWLAQPIQAPDSSPAFESPLAAVLDRVGGSLAEGNIPEMVSWDALQHALRLFIPLIPFDEAWYCERYPDVASALEDGLIASAHGHFIEHGFFEGRSPAASGHWAAAY